MSKEYAHCLLIIIFPLKSSCDKTHLKHLPLCILRLHVSTWGWHNPLFSNNENMLELLLVHQRIAQHSKQILPTCIHITFIPASSFFFYPLSSKCLAEIKIFFMDSSLKIFHFSKPFIKQKPKSQLVSLLLWVLITISY